MKIMKVIFGITKEDNGVNNAGRKQLDKTGYEN